MALEPKHAAIHEAGHAVVLWFVGWGEDLKWIRIRRVDGSAELARMKFNRRAPKSLSAIRSTLLVLFAGAAASDEHFGEPKRDIDDDWREAKHAVAEYYTPRTVKMRTDNRVGCEDPEAHALVMESLDRVNEVVRYPRVKAAIHAVADLLLDATPDQDGICTLPSTDVISVCERVCGATIRQQSPLTHWIAGSQQASTCFSQQGE